MEIVKNELYCVTGGGGFIGSGLIDKIVSKGALVRTIGNNMDELSILKTKYGDSDWRVRAYQTGRVLGDVGEMVIIGSITYGTGIAGAVGRGTSYLTGGSKLATYGIGVGLTGLSTGLEGYKGYQSYKALFRMDESRSCFIDGIGWS
jgi:hypothetical protein